MSVVTPYFLWENVFTADGGTVSFSSELDGWPHTNLFDWRPGTAYRWSVDKTTGIDAHVTVDLGAGNEILCDTFGMAGHNINEWTVLGDTFAVQYSDDGAAWTDAYTGGGFALASTALPILSPLTSPPGAAKRYWRLELRNDIPAPFGVDPTIGVFTLGRRLELPGLTAEAEPHSRSALIDWVDNQDGKFIGANLSHPEVSFRLSYLKAGIDRDTHFRPASGLSIDTDFRAHLYGDKPFWWAYFKDLVSTGSLGFLCRARDFRFPLVGTKQRRGFEADVRAFVGWS